MQFICTLLLAAAAALLPGNGVPDGWVVSGEPMVFSGGALFEHINGGADRYHELGFVDLIVQSYTSGDDEVQVEIYDMGSAEGAATIFSEVMAGLETDTAFGDASTHDSYQIAFHRGQFYVSVLAFSEGDGVEQAMQALARAVESGIKTN